MLYLIEQEKQTCLKGCSRENIASAASYPTWVSTVLLLLMLNFL